MGAYDKFKVAPDLEKKGVILDYTNFRVTIARAGGNNERFEKVLEKKAQPYMRAIQTETMDNSKAEQILLEVYADTIIIGWEVPGKEEGTWKSGIEDPDDGKILPFKPENVLKVLQHESLRDLWIDIKMSAQKATLFRASIAEAQAGN